MQNNIPQASDDVVFQSILQKIPEEYQHATVLIIDSVEEYLPFQKPYCALQYSKNSGFQITLEENASDWQKEAKNSELSYISLVETTGKSLQAIQLELINRIRDALTR